MLKKIVFVVPILFFLISILTLNDYGINWDEPVHFNRGQGYLYYFQTGKKAQDAQINNNPSFFHGYDVHDLYDWDGGHPVTSDILAALSNFIFFQNLRVVDDIGGYHLYNLATAFLLVLVVSIFSYRVLGLFPSLVSSLVLASYPLFFPESHFNIKDPPQSSFFALGIFFFWLSLDKGNWKWLLLAAISGGLAFGTKFNVLFLPFILLPYLFIRYFHLIKNLPLKLSMELKNKIPTGYLLALCSFPAIVVGILFVSWPFLWVDTVKHLLKVANYYRDIGTGFNYQPTEYMIGDFNLYALFWIIVTSPIWTLLLLSVGILMSLLKPDGKKTTVLWFLRFAIPIVRVSIPGTTIYGGVRQIMEFLPALALLSGLGSYWLVKWISRPVSKIFSKRVKIILPILVLLGFSPQIIDMVKLHPNQNVYFNSFVGGLSGAKEKNIPSWGNSYGNAYWQAIQWINKNAEQNSYLALIQGTGQNVPLIQLRKDIDFSGNNWSGINRRGEYLMELTYEGSIRAYPYVWDYVEEFLEPVYEVRADGVAIAKVWKNDLEHTKISMRKKEVEYKNFKKSEWKKNYLGIDLGTPKELTRMVLENTGPDGCSSSGSVELSVDGETWIKEKDEIFSEQVLRELDFNDGVNFYFPGSAARRIKINLRDNSCYSEQSKINIYVLE